MPQFITIEELRELIAALPDDQIIRIEFLREDDDDREETAPVQAE
jgi:hypothetical protein